jgi:DNA polymerase-1
MVEDWNLRAAASSDGRIHGGVNAQGAATGRCTHNQPNVAQVSGDHRARELWVPGYDGWVQVGADLKGLELRMLAHYMHRYDGGKYADVLLHGDIHTHNMEAAGIDSRNLAKSFIYAYLYGAGNTKIASVLNCSVREAEKLRQRFQKEIPALAKVQQEVQYQVAKYKSVELPDGRRVPVRSEHAALNTLLQGAGAIVSKMWMLVAHQDLRQSKLRVRQMAYIHDELQYAALQCDAEGVGEIVKNAARLAGERLNMKIPIDADYVIGTTWADTH